MKSARGIAVAALGLACGAACTPGPIDVATIAPNNLAMGLVAHWTFDEGAGATAHDSSGNLRDGAISGTDPFGGGWSWAPGHFDGALHFTGSDQVTVGSPPFPQATASYTVAAWLLVQYGDFDPPLAAILSTEGFGGGWSMNLAPPPPPPGGGGSYRFAYPIGPTAQDYIFIECDCFVWNQWMHLAAVLDADTATLTMYVNGAQMVQVPAAQPIGPHPGTLFIGRWPAPGRNLAGTVDDIAIYSRALVPQEIALLAAAPAPNPM